MKTGFTKMHGCGNDFIMIDNMSGEKTLTEDQVVLLCDRHFGIGADGVILVEPPITDGSAAFMNYINSDGTFAEMCGNGVRCFAKYLVDNGIYTGDGPMTVDTRAGQRAISFDVDPEGSLSTATVDMGEPVLEPGDVPVAIEANAVTEDGFRFGMEFPIDSPWGPFEFTFVSMGNPHAVTFIDDIGALPDSLFPAGEGRSIENMRIDEIGAFFESNPVFPEKANIEFAVLQPDGIRMRVFERGCGETYACGTGACATNVAAFLTGRAGRKNRVILNGGILDIDWEEDGDVIMTGPASESFTGEVVTN